MTTGRSTADPQDEQDVELERRLRAGFAGASAPGAPESVHAEAARLGSGSKVRFRPSARGLRSYAFLAVALVSLVLIGSLLAVGSGPSPSVPPASPIWAVPSAPPTTPGASAAITVSPSPTAPPEATPFPVVESLTPAADDVLPLAGRDRIPGTLVCSNHPFGFDGLSAPMGAEDRVGPEYDALRSGFQRSVFAPSELPRRGSGFREAGRGGDSILFLAEKSRLVEGGPFITIKVQRRGDAWDFTGGGDCQPSGLPSPGYGGATWTLNPAFRAPGPTTRTLHILVSELACASGRDASGRIAPAFVVESREQVAIEVFVLGLEGGGDCQGAAPTPATIRLPFELGDRALFDTGALGLGGAGG